DDRIEVTFVDPDAEEAEPAAAPQPTTLNLEHLVLSARGAPEESEFLQAETERLRGIVDGDGWRGRKDRDLEAMRSKAFWESSETGLHLFEIPQRKRSFSRIAVRVAVAPLPFAAPETDPGSLARSALAELPSATTIVRRYRVGPSPLVRDAVHDWRTGRLDRVLAGDFDVIANT